MYYTRSVVCAAIQLVVRWMSRTERIGHGVVDIAYLGRRIASREPARQITPSHKLRRRRRRPVSRLGLPIRDGQGLQLGRLGQVPHRLGRQDPKPRQEAWVIASTVDSRLLGQHMYDRPTQCFSFSHRRAVRCSALALQPLQSAGQRPNRVGTTLHRRARIIRAHSGRQSLQPLVQHRGTRGVNVGPNTGHPGAGLVNFDIPVVVDARRHTHPSRVELGHP